MGFLNLFKRTPKPLKKPAVPFDFPFTILSDLKPEHVLSAWQSAPRGDSTPVVVVWDENMQDLGNDPAPSPKTSTWMLFCMNGWKINSAMKRRAASLSEQNPIPRHDHRLWHALTRGIPQSASRKFPRQIRGRSCAISPLAAGMSVPTQVLPKPS